MHSLFLNLYNYVFHNVFLLHFGRIIRLTSPNLNYFMIVGAFMVYFSVFIRVLPTTDMLAWEFICSVSLLILFYHLSSCWHSCQT